MLGTHPGAVLCVCWDAVERPCHVDNCLRPGGGRGEVTFFTSSGQGSGVRRLPGPQRFVCRVAGVHDHHQGLQLFQLVTVQQPFCLEISQVPEDIMPRIGKVIRRHRVVGVTYGQQPEREDKFHVTVEGQLAIPDEERVLVFRRQPVGGGAPFPVNHPHT
eukprot:16434420-Heterocapsa_arctica.AAC.2